MFLLEHNCLVMTVFKSQFQVQWQAGDSMHVQGAIFLLLVFEHRSIFLQSYESESSQTCWNRCVRPGVLFELCSTQFQ